VPHRVFVLIDVPVYASVNRTASVHADLLLWTPLHVGRAARCIVTSPQREVAFSGTAGASRLEIARRAVSKPVR